MNKEKEIFKVAEEIKYFEDKIAELQELDYNKIEVYSKNIFNLKLRLQKLENNFYLERNPDYEGEEIDLYIKNIHDTIDENPNQLCFIITKHNGKEKIGTIDVRFKLLNSEKYLGNIGTNINKEYRGNRYACKAFKLLGDIMIEHGLTKPIFTVKEDNSSSIKSLNNIGAEKIEHVENADEPYYVYEYDLLESNKSRKM